VKPFARFAVPPGVVTATDFMPAALAGVTAVTVVAFTTLTEVAATPPTVTAVVPVRFVPFIVIDVPPEVGPAVGLNDAIVGCVKYVKPFARFATPPSVMTETVFAPALFAGVVAVTVVELRTLTEFATTPPIDTALVPVRFVPVIVIDVPPAVEPEFGLTEEIVGGAKYVKPFARFAVPVGVVTETTCGPGWPTGVTAVTVVESTTETDVAATPPILTLEAPDRLVPVIVTAVPPIAGPTFGLIEMMVGAAHGGDWPHRTRSSERSAAPTCPSPSRSP
jgi:hypothetical protein